MSMNAPETIKILVNLNMRYSAAREMIGGILRYAAVHKELEVQFTGGTPDDDPVDFYREWKPDCLVTDATYHRYSRKELDIVSGRAAVFANVMPPAAFAKPHAVITSDDRALADAAVGLFRKKCLTHFAFIGTPSPIPWNESRKRQFLSAVAKVPGQTGHIFATRMPHDSTWTEQRKLIADWLLTLPKPCGVWVSCDQRAKHVIDSCRHVGIAIPEQVQVLGTDNEAYLCEQLRPSLSSLSPDFEQGGFAAAEYLISTLRSHRRKSTVTPLTFALKGVVERLSTADVNGFARRISAARELIRKLAARPETDIPYIAMALGVSQRLLERNFQTVIGQTVQSALRNERLQLVKDMLRRTKTPIESIAPLCGFTSSCYLKTLFRKTFGMTMSEFRRK